MDTDGFDAAMAEQKAKARAAWSGSGEAADATIWFDVADEHGTTDFLGYDTETAEGQIAALVVDGVGKRSCGRRRIGADRPEPDTVLRRKRRAGR